MNLILAKSLEKLKNWDLSAFAEIVSIRYQSYKNNVPESQTPHYNQEAQLNKVETTSTLHIYLISVLFPTVMIKYPDKWIFRKTFFGLQTTIMGNSRKQKLEKAAHFHP